MPYKNAEDRRAAQKRWRENHADEKNKRDKAWWAAHPDKLKAKKNRYYLKHREELLAQMKDRYYNQPGARDTHIAKAKERYERIKGTPQLGWNMLHSKVARNNRPLTLTFKEYEKIVAARKCHYCGNGLSPAGHGLDRLDNQLGYTKENVVPCCSICNWNKGRLEAVGFRYPRTVELLEELIRGSVPASVVVNS